MANAQPTSRPGTKTRILKAAVQCFAEDGFQGASIRKIGKLCGLTQPSIYHHFGSKENLYRHAARASRFSVLRYLNQNLVTEHGLRTELLSYFPVLTEWGRMISGTAPRKNFYGLLEFMHVAPAEIVNENSRNFSMSVKKIVRESFMRHAATTRLGDRVACFNMLINGFFFEVTSITPGKFDVAGVLDTIDFLAGVTHESHEFTYTEIAQMVAEKIHRK